MPDELAKNIWTNKINAQFKKIRKMVHLACFVRFVNEPKNSTIIHDGSSFEH